MRPSTFKAATGELHLPLFFPDATRAIVRTVDSADIENTRTPGILVNTYHLYKELGKKVIKQLGGVKGFMAWRGATISDSGGFQIMTLVKQNHTGKVTDEGVTFRQGKTKVSLTPETSIEYQMLLGTDLMVVLDDFTPPEASEEQARESVERTIIWAKRSKAAFETECERREISPEKRPYLVGVVQGGKFLDLRAECTKRLVEIGFDGVGYGGWPLKEEGGFNYEVAQVIAENAPENYLLYGLGVGKPDEIAGCVKQGYGIFDCVLPTRDARHRRLYVYTAGSIDQIDLTQPKFYEYFTPDKERYYSDDRPVSPACDCLLCTRYSRAYLAHLFRIEEITALRLATIHNLRFYSLLMEKLRLPSTPGVA